MQPTDLGASASPTISVGVWPSKATYLEERPHQGLGNELIAPRTTVIGTGLITCHERLGGLLKFCDREAA